jgi:hypothetical protein
LNDDLIAGANKREFVNIAKVEEIISKSNTTNLGEIISNLSFGFWVSFLYPNYELGLWRPALRAIFPQDQKITRKEIHQKLERIKLIRNRAVHHEFILKHDLRSYHKTIYEILHYLSPELIDWTSSLDRFPQIFLKYEDFLAKI